VERVSGLSFNEQEVIRTNHKQQKEIEGAQRQPMQVHLPGFITEEEVGLGDVIKRVTGSFGIRPCGGCERRAAALNRFMTFTGRPR
jgi:hypothetical protein